MQKRGADGADIDGDDDAMKMETETEVQNLSFRGFRVHFMLSCILSFVRRNVCDRSLFTMSTCSTPLVLPRAWTWSLPFPACLYSLLSWTLFT